MKRPLGRREIMVLGAVKAKGLREKSVAKSIGLDRQLVADIITDLMLMGYIERRTRRWMVFFFREYFIITLEGLDALESSRSELDRMVEFLKEKGRIMINNILDGLPPIASGSLRITYRTAKLLMK